MSKFLSLAAYREYIVEQLSAITERFQAQYEADLFLTEVLHCTKQDIRLDKPVSQNFDVAFEVKHFLERRLRLREPIQYILGFSYFYGQKFKVTKETLIPRPETEILVEKALGFMESYASGNLLDVGTGTGCIILSLAGRGGSQFIYYATDCNKGALETACDNWQTLVPYKDVRFIHTHLLEGIGEKFCLIVSNPPYISTKDYVVLDPEVRVHEPQGALVGGENGIELIASIIQTSRQKLIGGGRLMLEIGSGQSREVSQLLSDYAYQEITLYKDLSGIERVVCAVWK